MGFQLLRKSFMWRHLLEYQLQLLRGMERTRRRFQQRWSLLQELMGSRPPKRFITSKRRCGIRAQQLFLTKLKLLNPQALHLGSQPSCRVEKVQLFIVNKQSFRLTLQQWILHRHIQMERLPQQIRSKRGLVHLNYLQLRPKPQD